MDDTTGALRDTRTNSHIVDKRLNMLSCADDKVVLAPTVDALQDLIDVCEVYAAKHDFVYTIT